MVQRRVPTSLLPTRGRGSQPSGQPPASSSRPPTSSSRAPSLGQPQRDGRNKRPAVEADTDVQPLQSRARRAPSSQAGPEVVASEEVVHWAPSFITDGGRRVNHADAACRDPAVAVALGRGVLLPRDTLSAQGEVDLVFAKTLQNMIMAMNRVAVLHGHAQESSRDLEREKARAEAERARAEDLAAQLEAAKVAIDNADSKMGRAESRASEALGLAESLKVEVERLRAAKADAEDIAYNQGFEEAEVAYKKQVEEIVGDEYSAGARAGWFLGYQFLVDAAGLTQESPLFSAPEPNPEWLARPSDGSASAEPIPEPPPTSEPEAAPSPPAEGDAEPTPAFAV